MRERHADQGSLSRNITGQPSAAMSNRQEVAARLRVGRNVKILSLHYVRVTARCFRSPKGIATGQPDTHKPSPTAYTWGPVTLRTRSRLYEIRSEIR